MPPGECISLKKMLRKMCNVEDDVGALRNEIGQMKGKMKAYVYIVRLVKKAERERGWLRQYV